MQVIPQDTILYPLDWEKLRSKISTRIREECGNFIHGRWVQPLWKTIQQYLIKLNLDRSYNPVILLQDVHTPERAFSMGVILVLRRVGCA